MFTDIRQGVPAKIMAIFGAVEALGDEGRVVDDLCGSKREGRARSAGCFESQAHGLVLEKSLPMLLDGGKRGWPLLLEKLPITFFRVSG